MRLNKLEIRGLYGSLDKDIAFNKDLNLLVGINGSGKTSVLNVIDWLLRPQYPFLATTVFQRITLWFTFDGKSAKIDARQSASKVVISMDGEGCHFDPISVSLQLHPSRIPDGADRAAVRSQYAHLGPEKHELPLWNALQKLPKPIVIALDRSLSAETEDEYFIETEIPHGRQRTRRRSPISKVKDVASARYAEYRSKVIKAGDMLKARAMLSALHVPSYPTLHRNAAAPVITPQKLERLERKVTEHLAGIISTRDSRREISSFFNQARNLLHAATAARTAGESEAVWHFLRQFYQIEDLSKSFDVYDTECATAFRSLERYLYHVNQFFGDSRKLVDFDERTNQLGFRYLDRAGTPETTRRRIDDLSSGEHQILILFTFLSFVAEASRLFIVDEPELSLHPKWQKQFVPAFLELRPASAQLLLATHSPEIVGSQTESCIVLMP